MRDPVGKVQRVLRGEFAPFGEGEPGRDFLLNRCVGLRRRAVDVASPWPL